MLYLFCFLGGLFLGIGVCVLWAWRAMNPYE